MQKLKLVAILASLGLMTACASQQDTTMANNITQLKGEWNITEVNNTKVDQLAEDVKPFIGFDVEQNRIYGKSTCNNIIGDYKYDETNATLSFTQVGTTMMMCPFMDQEQLMLKALNDVKSFDVQGDKAYLLDQNKQIIFKLIKK